MTLRYVSHTLVILYLFTSMAFCSDKEEANKRYETSLEQLKSGKTDIDYVVFRLSCAASKYTCEADSDDVKKIRTAIESKKFNEGLKLVDKALEQVFVDI